MAVNMAIVTLNILIYPMPEGVDFGDAEGMAAYIATLPLVAMLIVLLAHLGQAFAGGWLAARISKNRSMVVAMIVGVLTLIAGLINMMSMPHPNWMWIEMPLYLVAAWAAAKIELKRRHRLPSTDPQIS
jgi:nitrate/nitrite transporter NarK